MTCESSFHHTFRPTEKKTYPAIFDLFRDNSLAKDTIVVGFARSKMSKAAFDEKLTPWLLKSGTEAEVKAFLEICIYRNGAGYDDGEAMGSISRELRDMHGVGDAEVENRIFYFAIPPNSFLATARNVKANALTGKGFNRVVVEKPFGHSLESAEKLGKDLGEVFTEDYLYRIDHYLGKEMVQNIITLRFGNAFLEPLFNSQHMQCVIITFKESFGTQGRGGYFDSIGIIRDVVQNHLMQLLSILAMEAPTRVAGPGYSNAVRDEKVKVLSAMEPWKVEDCVLGQYEAANGEPGYQDDETVPEGSNCPTYVAVKFFINNRRWSGVPFIIKAGKALDESKVEVRMQFKDSPGANAMFQDQAIPRNELVLRLQPSEAIYMKTNIKKPGLYTAVQVRVFCFVAQAPCSDVVPPLMYCGTPVFRCSSSWNNVGTTSRTSREGGVNREVHGVQSSQLTLTRSNNHKQSQTLTNN